MARTELQVELRESRKKGPARRLRATGGVPAILYGPNTDAISISVPHRALDRVVESNQLIDLTGHPSVEGRPVLVKDFHRDSVSRRIVHCDFYAVDTSRATETTVPIHFSGKAKGVELGGVLETLMREVEVRCLPTAIPSVLDIDVTNLDVGDSLHTSDIPLPEGVELISDPKLSIAHVIASRAAASAAASEGDGAEEESDAAG